MTQKPYLEATTFSTMSKNHQLTTTKERQIDFMWHLYGQGFTQKEIATVYNVSIHRITSAFRSKVKQQQS